MAEKAVTKIQAFEDGSVVGEILTAGKHDCTNIAEIFTALGPDREQQTKDDGDCNDVYENVKAD
jgi:hypothetical protein